MKIELPKIEFQEIQIGDNQLFKVTAAVYDEESRKVRITYNDKNGASHSEFFKLYDKDANGNIAPNSVGLRMFSILYRGITGNTDATDAELDELVGRYFTADVTQGAAKQNGDGYWLNVYSKRPSDQTFDEVTENSDDYVW